MVELSLPRSQNVRGYEIRRLPLGKYLQAMEMLRHTPERMLRACFPGMSTEAALGELRRIDAQMLLNLMSNGAGALCQELARLMAVTMDIDEQALLADENVGLDGLMEMVEAFWTLNRMENFIGAVRALAAQAMAAARTERTGCSV